MLLINQDFIYIHKMFLYNLQLTPLIYLHSQRKITITISRYKLCEGPLLCLIRLWSHLCVNHMVTFLTFN